MYDDPEIEQFFADLFPTNNKSSPEFCEIVIDFETSRYFNIATELGELVNFAIESIADEKAVFFGPASRKSDLGNKISPKDNFAGFGAFWVQFNIEKSRSEDDYFFDNFCYLMNIFSYYVECKSLQPSYIVHSDLCVDFYWCLTEPFFFSDEERCFVHFSFDEQGEEKIELEWDDFSLRVAGIYVDTDIHKPERKIELVRDNHLLRVPEIHVDENTHEPEYVTLHKYTDRKYEQHRLKNLIQDFAREIEEARQLLEYRPQQKDEFFDQFPWNYLRDNENDSSW